MILSPGQVEPFVYRVTVLRVVDGDTLDVDIDLGFSMQLMGQRLRLLRVNTPETKGATREAGMRAKAFTRDWLGCHSNIMIRSRKREPGHAEKGAFGRYLVEVYGDNSRKREPGHAEKDAFGRYLVEVYGDNEKGEQSCLNDALLSTGNAVPFREND